MHLYLIFLVITPVVEKRYSFFIDKRTLQYDGKNKVCLYGFSKNKKYVKRFKECRESYLFHIQKVETTYQDFLNWYPTKWVYELQEVYFEKERIPMYITEMEKYAITHMDNELLYNESLEFKKSNFQSFDINLGKVVKVSMNKLNKMSNFEKWLALFSPTIDPMKLLDYLRKEPKSAKKYMDIL